MSAFSAKTEFAFDASGPSPHQYQGRSAAGYSPVAARPGLSRRLASAMQWIAEQPRRRALINELGALTDHELADIGLARGDLARVFDRDFSAARRI